MLKIVMIMMMMTQPKKSHPCPKCKKMEISRKNSVTAIGMESRNFSRNTKTDPKKSQKIPVKDSRTTIQFQKF